MLTCLLEVWVAWLLWWWGILWTQWKWDSTPCKQEGGNSARNCFLKLGSTGQKPWGEPSHLETYFTWRDIFSDGNCSYRYGTYGEGESPATSSPFQVHWAGELLVLHPENRGLVRCLQGFPLDPGQGQSCLLFIFCHLRAAEDPGWYSFPVITAGKAFMWLQLVQYFQVITAGTVFSSDYSWYSLF